MERKKTKNQTTLYRAGKEWVIYCATRLSSKVFISPCWKEASDGTTRDWSALTVLLRPPGTSRTTWWIWIANWTWLLPPGLPRSEAVGLGPTGRVSASLVITLGSQSLTEQPALAAPQRVPQFPSSYPDDRLEGIREKGNHRCLTNLHCCFHKNGSSCLLQPDSVGILTQFSITDHCVNHLFSMEWRTLSVFLRKTSMSSNGSVMTSPGILDALRFIWAVSVEHVSGISLALVLCGSATIQ